MEKEIGNNSKKEKIRLAFLVHIRYAKDVIMSKNHNLIVIENETLTKKE